MSVSESGRLDAAEATPAVRGISLRNESADKPVVYNLTVLVQQQASGCMARAANLSLDVVEAGSVRNALSQIVATAKSLIAERVAQDQPVPWLDPPVEPADSESRFMVPLHL